MTDTTTNDAAEDMRELMESLREAFYSMRKLNKKQRLRVLWWLLKNSFTKVPKV